MAKFNGLLFANSLPQSPGVYKMYDSKKSLLYIGKAKNLQNRVKSYFQKSDLSARIANMVELIHSIEIISVPTEVDALILESQLIRSENPKYNVALKDGSGYPYLFVSTDKEIPSIKIHYGKINDKNNRGRYFGPYPSTDALKQSLETLQKHFKLRTCSDYFFANRTRPCLEYQIKRCSGPCVGKIKKEDYLENVKDLILVLEGKSDSVINALTKKMLSYSDNLDFENAAITRNEIASLQKIRVQVSVEMGFRDKDVLAWDISSGILLLAILQIREGKIISSKTRQLEVFDLNVSEIISSFVMQYLFNQNQGISSNALKELLLCCNFEENPEDMQILIDAAKSLFNCKISFKDKLSNTKNKKIEDKSDEIHCNIALSTAKASLNSLIATTNIQKEKLNDLIKILGLPKIPQRMECFDISHTSGNMAVASCVVFNESGPVKSQYRKYNISGITPSDDYAAINQALTRRFAPKSVLKNKLPDVLFIDGGIGQVNQAINVLKHYQIDIPIIGISKGPDRKPGEETIIIARTGEELNLGQSRPALKLIQNIRDEAHRFAITSHRRKRDKASIRSILEDIEGLGPAKRKALLISFGGIQGIKNATIEQLTTVKGISLALATKIHQKLNS